jgi:hypothetical protein
MIQFSQLHHHAHRTEHDFVGRLLLVGVQRHVEWIGARFQFTHSLEPRRQHCLARGEFVGKRGGLIPIIVCGMACIAVALSRITCAKAFQRGNCASLI